MFYIVLLIGLILALFNKKGITTKIYAAVLILLAVFRYGCGADYFAYKYLYSRIHGSIILEITQPLDVQELGFRLIGVIFKLLNLPYEVYIAVFAAVSIYFIYRICIKYSVNPTLSLVAYYTCYYFFWTYSSLRQGFVMSIGIYYLLEAVHKQKVKKFIIITLLLSLIHISSLFLIVLYMVTKIKLGKSTLMILSFIGIVISVLPLGEIFLALSKFSSILKRVAAYVETSNSFNNILDFKTIGRIVFLIIAFIFYDSYCKDNPENRKILNMYIISFIVYFVLKFSEMTASRLSVYGKMLDIIILPNIIYLIKSKWTRSLYISFLVLLLFAYMFKDLSFMMTHCGLVNLDKYYTPYINLFNKDNYFFENGYINIVWN